MKELWVAALTVFTFALSTSGTLAYAKNAYQRSRIETRLREQRQSVEASQQMQTLKAVQKVLRGWDQYGSRVEDQFKNRLDHLLQAQLEKQLDYLDRMNVAEAAAFEAQFMQVSRASIRAGNVALAERLEQVSNSRYRPLEGIRDTLMAVHRSSIKDRIHETIRRAGSVKGALEEWVVKLTSSRYGPIKPVPPLKSNPVIDRSITFEGGMWLIFGVSAIMSIIGVVLLAGSAFLAGGLLLLGGVIGIVAWIVWDANYEPKTKKTK